MVAEQAACCQDQPRLSTEELEHFLRKGFLVVPSGVSPAVHQAVCSAASEVCSRGPHAAARLGDDVLPAIPELWDVLDAAPVRKALRTVLGDGCMLHGHRHLHISTTSDQMWHKDSYWGFRKIRHHRPRWCMLLYYPQDTTLQMGPTHVLAGSQYWTHDTEMWQRGEDILSPNDGHVDMFVEGSEHERKERLVEAQDNLVHKRYSHLVEDVALTVPAGSCVLMHYDLAHRGGGRTSDGEPMRFMFKFQFIRTLDPVASGLPPALGDVASKGSPELEPVLQDIRAWMRGEAANDKGLPAADLHIPGPGSSEVERLAAAYRLGRSGQRGWGPLLQALRGGEAAARAATYGLAAAGPEAASSLLPYLRHEWPRIRCAAAFALGESARPSGELLDHFEAAMRAERSPGVEAAMLQALSCLAARARALKEDGLCRRCVDICLPFLCPVQNAFSLQGENACLVALMAGGIHGDVGGKALSALLRVVEQTHDRYMGCFAHEVLRRRQLARPGAHPELGSCAVAAARAEETLTSEKKSRLTAGQKGVAMTLAPMSG